MDSIKDIISQIQKDQAPQDDSNPNQSKLFDTDKLKTNPKRFFGDKHKYVSQEYQSYGLRLAGKLGDQKRMTMYIKWAKEKPRAILEQALSFTSDYPNAKDKIKIFMWRVKDLENEYREKKQKNTK
ncbi:MAG: hypothetical protein AB9915_00925 [Candidatus Dojkabacteria bacterium]